MREPRNARGARRRQGTDQAAVASAMVLALVVTTLSTSGVASGAPAAPIPTTHACQGLPHVTCGSIVVPWYWGLAGGGGGTITVRFRIYRHTERSVTALEPVVAFEGGPGYGSIGSARGYGFLLGPLRARHDLIVMDQRGTGSSDAIDCPALQRGVGNYVNAVAACADRLGPAANAYGTAAVADDLHAILQGLGIPTADLYGDSYGTYAAQEFALRYPDEVRAIVLDGAFDNAFDPFEREASASLRRAWRAVCERSRACVGILRTIRGFDAALARHPVVGTARDSTGARIRVRLTAGTFATLVGDATYVYTIFRDLPAAIAAFHDGDRRPLLRLAAEDLAATGNGSPRAFSEGDYIAVSCHDYPTIWDPAADVASRRAQLDAAIRSLDPAAFAPFPDRVWLDSLYQHELVYGCLKWPRPTVADPALPNDAPRPHIPVLVLEGEFDQATPVADARAVSLAWPDATYVQIPNTAHITALADFQGCASTIARRFLRTLSAGDTACVARMPAVQAPRSFPIRLAAAPHARSAGSDDRSTATERRAAWVTAWTIGDAFARWLNVLYGGTGVGLRGGHFSMHGPYYGLGDLTIDLSGVRFVRDLAIDGTAVWDRATGWIRATVRVRGPHGLAGRLRVAFSTHAPGAIAVIRGRLDGRRADLSTPAPWSPQG